jgi:hypothetical protein
MEIIGLILLVIGGVISFVAGIWFLVVAFRESVLWGLGCLLIPFVSLIFLIIHWSEAKRPFLWSLLAIVPMVIGALMSQPSAHGY